MIPPGTYVENVIINKDVFDVFGPLTSLGYNLIGSTSGTVITGITTGNLLDEYPLLGPLQNNGGPTATNALRPFSPAIDAGSSVA